MNNKYEKLTKKEINKIVDDNISKQIYISFNITDIEEFRQIYVNNQYIPYLISSHGRVFSLYYKRSKSLNVKPLAISVGNHGYEKISLNYQHKVHTYQIHILVALAFIKNDNKKRIQVNHIDGVKTHNYVWNLEWCTPKENIIHAEKNGLRHHVYGTKHGRNIYDENTINRVCQLLEENDYTISEISKLTGVTTKMIYRIYKKKAWKYISDNYDIDNFNNINTVNPDEMEKRYEKIHQVCKLLENNEHTMKEISKITGVTYKIVSSIYNKRKYINIASKYNFSNYDKIKKRNKK